MWYKSLIDFWQFVLLNDLWGLGSKNKYACLDDPFWFCTFGTGDNIKNELCLLEGEENIEYVLLSNEKEFVELYTWNVIINMWPFFYLQYSSDRIE